ncbi:ABC-type oligopeptide transport system substrate-binding subunit [Bradyrhizobium sp. LM3.4]
MAITRRDLLLTGTAAAALPALGSVGGLPVGVAHAQSAGALTWRHALSLFGQVKYPADFKRFDYVNPEAPKGGVARQIAVGTFDNFNIVVSGVKGQVAGAVAFIYESLTTPSLDEVSTEYGALAEAVSHPDDFSFVTYRLRSDAKWHDGKPVTADDVIFSLDSFKKHHPQYSAYYSHVTKAEKVGEREVKFVFDAPGNRELPQIVGQLTVLPKHWWEGTDAQGRKRDVSATTLEVPLGSGPYRIKEFVAGRSIALERVKDYWGRDLAANVGRNNFDEMRYEYFRDATVAIEAFKADQVDWRTENSAKNWATAYDFPAVTEKRVILEEFANRSSGVMQAFVPNLRRAKFSDPRVRHALNYAFDFEEMNKQIFYGQYKRISSYFDGIDDLMATGLPQGKEFEILETVRAEVPPEGLHHGLHQPGRRQSGSRARESARGAAPVQGSRLRGARPQADRRQDRCPVLAGIAELGSELRADHAVLQAVAGTARHRGQRAHGRSDPIREQDQRVGFRRRHQLLGRVAVAG